MLSRLLQSMALLTLLLLGCGGDEIVVEDVRSKPIPKLELKIVTTEPYTEALTEFATSFTRDYPNYHVDLVEDQSAGSSFASALAESDVIVCNNRSVVENLVLRWDSLSAAGVSSPLSTSDSVTLWQDRLVVVVARDSGLGPKNLSDLRSNRYARIAVPPSTSSSYEVILQAMENDSADLRAKFMHATSMQRVIEMVTNGKAEAGIVYGSLRNSTLDVKGAFTIPFSLHDAILCRAMVRPGSPRASAARLFVRHMKAESGE